MHTLPAMFIPFTLHRDLDEARRGPYLEAVKMRFKYEERRFGVIFDRLRIAHFAHFCMNTEEGVRSLVDGADRFGNVQEWVTTALGLAGIGEPA
ncbi:MAG: hypothetical protein ACREOR_08715 [Candidatus Binatia bacterium]